MASDVGRFTKDLERSEEFCRNKKPDITANTAKHLCQRVEMKLPHCKVMQLSHGEPSDGRAGRGFTCQQAQQSDLKRGLPRHADTPLRKHQRCSANAPFAWSPTSLHRPARGTREGANSPAPGLLLSSRTPGTPARGHGLCPELHILLNVPKLQPLTSHKPVTAVPLDCLIRV